MSKPAQVPHQEKEITKAELEILRQKVSELVVNNIAKAATILTEWIHKDKKSR